MDKKLAYSNIRAAYMAGMISLLQVFEYIKEVEGIEFQRIVLEKPINLDKIRHSDQSEISQAACLYVNKGV